MNKKIVTVLSLALASAIVGNANAAEDIYNRAAVGNITVTGGASRIHGNMNEMYESQIKLAKKEHAKNVILLIGDGMGDSEITAARNYAYGAAGSFPGLDVYRQLGGHFSTTKNEHTRQLRGHSF